MSVAYWGPEIKVGEPQKALSINMDAATNIESVSCSFQLAGQSPADCLYPESANARPDSDPDPGHHAAQSAARLDPADPAQLRADQRIGELFADPRRGHWPNESRALGRGGHRYRHPERRRATASC